MPSTFAQRLKQARLDRASREGRNISQTEQADHLTKEVGNPSLVINTKKYNQWENGQAVPHQLVQDLVNKAIGD